VELNLVPLQDNAFTNCKSNLKYFEAGVTGTVTVASTTIPYCDAIEDGSNAFLARTQAWEETLARALAALDEYACIAERACEHSLAHYGWQAQADALEAALLAPCPPPTSRKDAHGPH
jgi:glycosyltransferase involved in cell wall biosynthesis